MAHDALLDTFADARRTWDDLVALQLDVKVGGGALKTADLVELKRRVDAHREALDLLADALDTDESNESADRGNSDSSIAPGISNRKSADDEAAERTKHPPADTGSPAPEDAAGRVGEQPLEDSRDRHTSHKAGSRSIAQKEARSRYPDRSMPSSRKVAGAFGKETGRKTRP